MDEVQLPANLSLSQDQRQLQFSPTFQNVVKQIKETVDHAKNLASVQIDQVDEQSLEIAISDLKNAQTLSRNINATRRDLKKYLRDRENNILDQFDNLLKSAGYDELETYNAKAKQMKKDLSAYRINTRWEDLKPTFEANLTNYPLIHQLAPKLEDFDLFRLRHPKLVNGSKSYKIGDKQIKAINQDLYDINTCLADLKNNAVHLTPNYQNSILQSFILKPDKDYYLEIKNQALIQMQKAIEEEKRQAEIRRQQEELQRQQQLLAQNVNQLQQQLGNLQQVLNATADQNQRQQIMNQIANIQQVITQKQQEAIKQNQAEIEAKKQQEEAQKAQFNVRDASFKWLSDYVMVNLHKYGNLKNDPVQKIQLIYDLMHSVDNTSSPLFEFLKKNSDKNITKQSEILLAMIGQIVNV